MKAKFSISIQFPEDIRNWQTFGEFPAEDVNLPIDELIARHIKPAVQQIIWNRDYDLQSKEKTT